MTASIVQIILLLAMVGLVAYLAASRCKARAEAGMKLGFVIFIVACLWAIMHPDDLTVVANWIDVTRGTDLLLYVLVLAFVFTTMSSYIRFREQELHYTQLARAMALKAAVHPEGEIVIPGSQDSSRRDNSTDVEKNAPSD